MSIGPGPGTRFYAGPVLPATFDPSGLQTPFGVPWDALTLDALWGFFGEAGDETLTWEAKGGVIHKEQVVRAASAFGNSLLGGFLVLGVSQAKKGGPWSVDGWPFPDEPTTWVSTCLMNDAVRPRPSFDVRAWPIGDRRQVAVVSIRPVSVPPVITRDGQVWERLSGLSQQIRDPADMRSLVQRGERALGAARQTAEEGRNDMIAAPPMERRCTIIVSMASPALIGDVVPIVFRQASYDAITALLNGRLAPPSIGGYHHNRLEGDLTQHALTEFSAGFSDSEGFSVRVGRHGSVVVGQSHGLVPDGLSTVAESADALRPTWEAAASLIEAYAGEVPVHVAVALWNDKRTWTHMARWTRVPGLWDEDMAFVMRESRRALGRTEWEP